MPSLFAKGYSLLRRIVRRSDRQLLKTYGCVQLLALLSSSAAIVLAAQSSAADTTVIHAGWLLRSPHEAPERRQTVVVAGDRIRSIEDGFLQVSDIAHVDGPVSVVDLSDAFVLPGLIDSHVHLATSPTALGNGAEQSESDYALRAAHHAGIALQAGFTTVVDLGSIGEPGHENAIFAVRDGVRDGWVTGPRILAAGTPIAAPGASRSSLDRDEVDRLKDYRSLCSGVDDCRRAVRHQVKRGSDVIAFFNTGSLLSENSIPQAMTDEEMRAIVTTAHALGRKVIADGHHAMGIAAALRAGADIIDSAHLYDVKNFELFGDNQFLQSHIYGVTQAIGETPETLSEGLWGWLPRPILLRFQQIKQRKFAMIAAHDAGIENLAYASDAGVYLWGENAGDLVEFVRRGMSPQTALATATSNAASMLGLAEEIGSINAGMAADIIAAPRNPLTDISAMMDISFVMRAGEVFRYKNLPVNPDLASESPP